MQHKHRWLIMAVLAVVIATAAVLVACDEAEEIIDEIRVEEPTDILFDGEYITWKKVNADYYTVAIDGGEPQRSNSTTFKFSSQSDFEVTITSVLGESTASASKMFRYLKPIDADSVVIASDGAVSWQAVGGANAYLVMVNGQQLTASVVDTVYDKFESGSNRVKIKPIVTGDDSFYSIWSDEVNVYIYKAPSSIKYDGTRLTWTGNASEYEVTTNGVSKIVKGNALDYNSGNSDFTVSVKAIGNHVSTFDSAEVTEEYHYLDPVTGLTAKDGMLVWNEVESAEGYRISINGIVQPQKITEATYALVSGKSVDVALMPYNDSGNYFSSWTDARTFYILGTPVTQWNSDLELDGEANNNFMWNGVDAAAGYQIKLVKDGVQVSVEPLASNLRSFGYAFEEVGVYEISVKATADPNDATYSDSAYSKPVRVERLAAPTRAASNFIVSDPNSVAKGFTVAFVGVNGATSYQLSKDGVPVANTTGSTITDGNVVLSDVATEQHYTYRLRSMGGVRNVSGTTYVTLSCLTADALSFDITVSAMPTGLTMAGFNASWDPVSGSYCVSYGGNTITANSETLDMSTIAPGTYNVAVCARGNGSDVLASNYTAPITVTRLDAPKNIRIIANDGNGKLTHDPVTYATSYSAYIGLSSEAIDETSWENMYDLVQTSGTDVSLTANANMYNDDKTMYYMTSPLSPTMRFVRLAAPTFEDGALSSNSSLVWKPSGNINTSEYTPTYSLKINNLDQTVSNGTSLSLEGLDAGTYTITVKAIGNEVKYLDSEESLAISFRKIAAPQMSVDKDGYHWPNDSDAVSFTLEIDGVRVADALTVDGKNYSYKPRYTTKGEHIVKLTAVGNGVDTVSSDPYVYTQVAQFLTMPTIEYAYSSPYGYVDGGSVTVTVTSPDQNASGYLYDVYGASETSTQTTFTKTIGAPGTVNIKVKTLGGTIDDNDIYYIDSVFTQTYSIVLLSAPNTDGFKFNGNGQFLWNTVQNASGYDYQLSFDDGKSWQAQVHVGGNASNKISNYADYETITIKVRASGSGSNKISSEWVTWTWDNPNK